MFFDKLEILYVNFVAKVKAQPWRKIGIAVAVGFVVGAIAGSR